MEHREIRGGTCLKHDNNGEMQLLANMMDKTAKGLVVRAPKGKTDAGDRAAKKR